MVDIKNAAPKVRASSREAPREEGMMLCYPAFAGSIVGESASSPSSETLYQVQRAASEGVVECNGVCRFGVVYIFNQQLKVVAYVKSGPI